MLVEIDEYKLVLQVKESLYSVPWRYTLRFVLLFSKVEDRGHLRITFETPEMRTLVFLYLNYDDMLSLLRRVEERQIRVVLETGIELVRLSFPVALRMLWETRSLVDAEMNNSSRISASV